MSRRIVLTILAIVLVATAVAVGASVALAGPAHERPEIADRLVAAVERAGAGGTVQLHEVTDFDWQEVHVFAPYASVTAMSEQLGFGWTPFSPLEQVLWGEWPLNSEDEFLLVFVDREANSVVGWTFTALADRAALFQVDGLSDSFSLGRDDACLQVLEMAEGPPRKSATVEPTRCPR
jgi:hypothetical protein